MKSLRPIFDQSAFWKTIVFHQEPRLRRTRGFTLIELLASMSVLSLLVLMMSSLLNSASTTLTSTTKYLNTDDEARMVLDRMQMDFNRMIKRSDVYFQFTKANGNDQCTFYSETPGFFPSGTPSTSQSNVSLISYQFNSTYQLQRLGQGCQWTDIAFSPTTGSTYTTSDFHVLGSTVFRMEMAYLKKVNDTSLELTTVAPTPGSPSLQNCYAIMVTIALLDADSQKLMSSSSYTTLISALPDYTGTTTISLNSTSPPSSTSSSAPTSAAINPIVAAWQTALSAPDFATAAGIPPAAAHQVRIYQRIIYLQ